MSNDLVGDISAKVQNVVDKSAQLRALIAAEKVPLASTVIQPPSKPVLIPVSASVASAATPQLTKAVPMPPLAPQPAPHVPRIQRQTWRDRAAARAEARKLNG